jgi:bacillithiol system protein YtxJ
MGIFDKIFGNKKVEVPEPQEKLEWFQIASVADLDAAIEYSQHQPILLFKHSTRCSISSSALDRLQRNWKGLEVNVKAFYLDLLSHRDISSDIAAKLQVEHQSPQMIIVKDGKAIFNASHMDISFDDVNQYAPSK